MVSAAYSTTILFLAINCCLAATEELKFSDYREAAAENFAAAQRGLKAAVSSGGPFTDSSPLSDAKFGPLPGRDALYSTYSQIAAPFPANVTDPVMNTTNGPTGPDDVLWQNLLSAEWIVFNFYQQGIEKFNQTSFTAAGFTNTTYQTLMSIRDNEAGHLRLFQDLISSTSVKPGPCKYDYYLSTPAVYMAAVTFIEAGTLAFISGLIQSAQLNSSKQALVAVAEVEARHSAWSLIVGWGADPFTGPSETAYPYPNQILDSENIYVIPGSCPKENPPYPIGAQGLPLITYTNISKVEPGGFLELAYFNPNKTATVAPGKQYYAVFFHGLFSISQPIPAITGNVTIPADIEDRGIIALCIADQPGAPTAESVVAGPLIITLAPKIINFLLPGQ